MASTSCWCHCHCRCVFHLGTSTSLPELLLLPRGVQALTEASIFLAWEKPFHFKSAAAANKGGLLLCVIFELHQQQYRPYKPAHSYTRHEHCPEEHAHACQRIDITHHYQVRASLIYHKASFFFLSPSKK